MVLTIIDKDLNEINTQLHFFLNTEKTEIQSVLGPMCAVVNMLLK